MKTSFAQILDAGIRLLRAESQPLPAGQPYARHVLHSGEAGDIVLCRWAPGISCAPHDHGGAEGRVLVVSGTLAESRFEFQGGELVEVEKLVTRAGDLSRIQREDIHQVTALDEAWTLHIYWNVGETFQIFDAGGHRTIEVRDTEASLPVEADKVVSIRSWS